MVAFGVDEQRAHAAMFFEADELAAVVFVVFEVIIKFADFFKIGEEGAGVLIQRGMQPVHGDGKALRPGSQRFSTRGEGASSGRRS